MSCGTVTTDPNNFRPPTIGRVYWRSPAGRWWAVQSVGRSLFDLAYRGLREFEVSAVTGIPAPADMLLIELDDGRGFRVRAGTVRQWGLARTPVFRDAWDETPL